MYSQRYRYSAAYRRHAGNALAGAQRNSHADLAASSAGLNGTHVADALRRFVTGFARRTSIRASLIVDEDLSCRSTDAAIALMRITQEALINVYRHANATEVKVDLSADDGTLVLKIMDNGKGV